MRGIQTALLFLWHHSDKEKAICLCLAAMEFFWVVLLPLKYCSAAQTSGACLARPLRHFFSCIIVIYIHIFRPSLSTPIDFTYNVGNVFCGFWNRDNNNPGWRGRDDDAVLACDYRIQLFSIKTVRACCCSLVILLNPCCLCFWFGSARTEACRCCPFGGREDGCSFCFFPSPIFLSKYATIATATATPITIITNTT